MISIPDNKNTNIYSNEPVNSIVLNRLHTQRAGSVSCPPNKTHAQIEQLNFSTFAIFSSQTTYELKPTAVGSSRTHTVTVTIMVLCYCHAKDKY